jgi:hypothetical protein
MRLCELSKAPSTLVREVRKKKNDMGCSRVENWIGHGRAAAKCDDPTAAPGGRSCLRAAGLR